MDRPRFDLGWVYLALGYTFIFLPVLVLVLFSFTSRDVPMPPFEGPSLEWYRRIFGNERMVDALVNSVTLAGGSSLVATVLGFLGAYGIARHSSRWEGLMRYLIMAPITVSYLIVGMGLLVTFHVMGVPKSLWAGGRRPRGHQPAVVLLHHPRRPRRAPTQPRAGPRTTSARASSRPSCASPCPSHSPRYSRPTASLSPWPGTSSIIAFLLTPFEVTLPVLLFEILRAGSSPELNAAGSVVFCSLDERGARRARPHPGPAAHSSRS